MSNMMDIIGAVIIGGFVLLGILTMTLWVQESETNTVMDNMVQFTATNVGSVIENDFRKIGFNVPLGSPKITAADSNSITFRGDVDSTGSIDTVRYYLGSTSTLISTSNPNDRPLYRIFNGTTFKGSNFGLTYFNLTYYDSLGNVTTAIANIRSVAIKMNIESTAANNGRYAGTFWSARFKPMNLSLKY